MPCSCSDFRSKFVPSTNITFRKEPSLRYTIPLRIVFMGIKSCVRAPAEFAILYELYAKLLRSVIYAPSHFTFSSNLTYSIKPFFKLRKALGLSWDSLFSLRDGILRGVDL